MASNGTVAHRFANKDYNFERGLKGSSVHIEGRSYYSYNTVFAQWVDEKLCIVYWGKTSITSNKHKIYPSSFPKDIVVLPYDDGWNKNGYSYYRGCSLLGWNGEFNFDKRVKLIDYYVHEIFLSLSTINGGKKKDLDLDAARAIYEYWGYIVKLCSLYKDTTVDAWLNKNRFDIDDEWERKKKLVKELNSNNTSVKKLVDIVFGKDTWKRYYDYCARYRKSENKRAKMALLCKRLGIENPYEGWQGEYVLSHDMTADDIRKLTAKERNDYHFTSIMHKEWKNGEDARNKKYNKNYRNAYKWIVGYEPKVESTWSGRLSKSCKEVRNMWTGDVYVVSEATYHSHIKLWGLKLNTSFDYDSFRKSDDKEEWIRNFYAECIEVDNNLRAISIFERFGKAVYTDQQIGYKTYRIYVLNDVLREGTTDEKYKLCEDFVNRWNAILQDKHARHRAELIARAQREEEERKEKEYMEQVKQEQIDECIKEGSEGCRNLWRKHLMTVDRARVRYMDFSVDVDGAFYYGGNVLLRLNLNKDKVETSKDIRIPVEVCKKMWRIVFKWHENPASFKPMEIDTKGSGKYTISSYENDILTAGCHDIAYVEMERMYNEIVKLENEAA